jgi:ketosteroid isomerase-like protein
MLRRVKVLPDRKERQKPMVQRAAVQQWLDGYVRAWKSYDPQAIGELFSEDATYFESPYGEPLRGRAAIVAYWLQEPDRPGTYDGHYEPIAIEGDIAVTNGRSRYFAEDAATLKDEWDNLFVLRFDNAGRCMEYREWFRKRPEPTARSLNSPAG